MPSSAPTSTQIYTLSLHDALPISLFSCAADVDADAELLRHRGFGEHRQIRRLLIVAVHNLDMIRLVLGHHLIAADAVGDAVHNRPLRRRAVPAPLRFFRSEERRVGKEWRCRCVSE